MTLSTARIIEPVVLKLLGTECFADTHASFGYQVSDPFAVSIEFGVHPPVTWLLGRELFREGLEHPTGLGDVRMWPAHGSPEVFYISLKSPQGSVLMEGPRRIALAFLARTDVLVPPDSEMSFVVVDAELNTLFPDGDVL